MIRILADAGVQAKNYKPDHVHKKLDGAFAKFDGESRHIDLLIGTHYDADHLVGLVPIIEDATIDIREAWLPPVANDTEPPTADGPPAAVISSFTNWMADRLRIPTPPASG